MPTGVCILKAKIMAMQPGDVIDDHLVESSLGGGAYGLVYKVRHQVSNDLMALKVAKVTGDPVDLARFNDENAIMHQLSPHAHILAPKSLVILHSPDVTYYTMDFADGNLTDHLYINSQLTTGELITIFKEVCAGIGHAHQSNVVHRDLHWGNILLKSDNASWIVKLADFGKAKDLSKESSLTSAEPCWGWLVKPPEVNFHVWGTTPTLSNLVVGDMYALGIILFFLFRDTPLISVVGLNRTITVFLAAQGSLVSMSDAERQTAYKEWLKVVRPENHAFSLQLSDTEDTRKINYLLNHLTNIDHSKRFACVSDLQAKLTEFFP